MFGNVVARACKGERFEDAIAKAKRDAGVETDAELAVDALRAAGRRSSRASTTSPRTRRSSCASAIRAVFDSWTGERAVSYRRINRIPDDWGTAVNVQQMVFGNKGEDSATGRRLQPRRGHRRARAVAAISSSTPRARTWSQACAPPATSPSCADVMPEAYEQLMEIMRTLESEYKNMQDVEFTVEEGQLYMLQTRNAKRPAQAAVRFAVDAVVRGAADPGAGAAHDRRLFARTRCSTRRSTAATATRCWRTGVAASPGAAAGEIVFTAADAVAQARAGQGRDPGPAVHRGRRRGRLPRRQGDPDLRGRQGLARRARGARDGGAGGDRRARWRSTSRPAS